MSFGSKSHLLAVDGAASLTCTSTSIAFETSSESDAISGVDFGAIFVALLRLAGFISSSESSAAIKSSMSAGD